MVSSFSNRRRQRSVRVTVASALLAVATIVVLVALPTQSPTWLSVSSVLAMLCGITASRIIYTETLQSRRENAADRAAQAQAYREIFSTRVAEHAEFTTAMSGRLASRDGSIQALESAIVIAEERTIDAEQRVKREARRANEAQERVAELQELLEIKKAEEADELALWDGWEGSLDAGTVVELLAWEDSAEARTQAAASADQKKRA